MAQATQRRKEETEIAPENDGGQYFFWLGGEILKLTSPFAFGRWNRQFNSKN